MKNGSEHTHYFSTTVSFLMKKDNSDFALSLNACTECLEKASYEQSWSISRLISKMKIIFDFF